MKILCALLLPFFLFAAVNYETKNYVEYVKGNLPILLSAPHGGTLMPENIPTRTYGKKGTDRYTDELTQIIAQKLFEKTGKTPYVVILKLARKKLDANREIHEAAQNNEKAIEVYTTYHTLIQDFRKERKFIFLYT